MNSKEHKLKEVHKQIHHKHLRTKKKNLQAASKKQHPGEKQLG